MTPIIGTIASQISGHLTSYAFESIATVNVSTDTNSISFTSIPQTYKHLQLRIVAKNTVNVASPAAGNSDISASFNGDTTYTNYYSHSTYGDGTDVGVYTANEASYYAAIGSASWGKSAQTNIFANAVSDILDYTNTNKYKTIKQISGGMKGSSGGDLKFASSVWRSTAAITSMTLYNVYTNWDFKQYSSFALYGVK